MKSLIKFVVEAKEQKDKNILSFKDFRKAFFAEEPLNVNDYWNIEIDINIHEFNFIDKLYIRYFDRKKDFKLEYLGKNEKNIKLNNRGNGMINIYTNGMYIEYNKKYIIIADKKILNII